MSKHCISHPHSPLFLVSISQAQACCSWPWVLASSQHSAVCLIHMFSPVTSVESFSPAISFYNVVLVGKPPWCQAQERKGQLTGGICVPEPALCAPLDEGTTMCLLTMVSSCSQLSTQLSRHPALGLLPILLWQRLLDHVGSLLTRDSQPRRLAISGLLLLLNHVYDTAFVHGQCLQTQFLFKYKVFGSLRVQNPNFVIFPFVLWPS